jgi:hypothetical protein
MNDKRKTQHELSILRAIQRDMDIITAGLLLAGQFTIIGIFITPDGFALSVGGPLSGESRIESKNNNQAVDATIDAIDILLAMLLISGKVGIGAITLSSDGFSFTIAGPIFGTQKPDPTLPNAPKVFKEFNTVVSKYFDIDLDSQKN